MMKRRTLRWSVWSSLVVALWSPAGAHAQDTSPSTTQTLGEGYHAQATVRYWSPSADLVVSSDSRGLPGTRIDIRNDLGLTSRRFPEVQLVLKPGLRHKFLLQYIPIQYESAATLHRDLVFNGLRYRTGQLVSSRFDWKAYRVGYEYDFCVRQRWFAGILAEVKHTDISVHLTSATADEVARQQMPIPALGGVVRVYPTRRIALTGELTFFAVPEQPDGHYGGHYADLDLSGTANVTNRLGAQVGLRRLNIGHLGAWDTGMFTLNGFYVGAVVRY